MKGTRECFLFRELDSEHLDEVMRLLEPLVYKEKELIFKTNDKAEGIYVVIKGVVEIAFDIDLEHDDELY